MGFAGRAHATSGNQPVVVSSASRRRCAKAALISVHRRLVGETEKRRELRRREHHLRCRRELLPTAAPGRQRCVALSLRERSAVSVNT